MADELEFKSLLSNLLKARFPYIYIPTWEEDRVLSVINTISTDPNLIKTPRTVYIWKLTTGLTKNGKDVSSDTKSPLNALEYIEKSDEPAIFVFLDFHIYLGSTGMCNPDPKIIRKIRDLSPLLRESKSPKNVIFISPSVMLPDELQKEVSIVDFNLPPVEDIMNLLEDMIVVNQPGKIIIDLSPNEKEHIAKSALGLTLQEAENAFARAMVEGGNFDIKKLDVILEEKRQIIKKSEILEFINSDLHMDDVGGLQNLKRWLGKRNKSWLDSAKHYGITAPNGVLITGVPGCGKSLIVKAISAMWQLPLLRLDIGKVFSGIVGSSEENMRKAIKIAEATSPSILWIDEIEKGFSGGGGDGGTSSRVFGTFLTWMQEKEKPVFVAATANNIKMLPSEFLRKGRFDEIFFVDLPTYKERSDIFQIHMKKRLNEEVIGDFKLNDDFYSYLAELTEGYVGAEIEQIVISGLFEAFSEDRPIKIGDFEKSIKNTVPLSVTQAEQIRAIREWANVRAVAATSADDSADYIKEIGESELKPDKHGIDEDIGSSRGGRAIDL
jgi:SpoVK/Ycf46/Vps4 family AAA+-type ATPase